MFYQSSIKYCYNGDVRFLWERAKYIDVLYYIYCLGLSIRLIPWSPTAEVPPSGTDKDTVVVLMMVY